MTDHIEQVQRALWDAGLREDHDVRLAFAKAAYLATLRAIRDTQVGDMPADDYWCDRIDRFIAEAESNE